MIKKSLFALFIVPLFLLSCSKEEIKLNKNVEGSKLTKEFCIDLVRNHWNCSMGAHYVQQNDYRVSPQWRYIEFGCYEGDRGKIINCINNMFDEPDGGILDFGKSYYKNYVLYLYLYYTSTYPTVDCELTVNF